MIKNNNALNEKVFNITSNYRPDLILLGHNNIINSDVIEKIKAQYKTKFALWYEDHLINGGPNYLNNLTLFKGTLFDNSSTDIAPAKEPNNRDN